MGDGVPDRARDVAAILLDLADEFGVDRVSRVAIRRAWIEDRPEHGAPRVAANPHAVARQRKDHRRATSGTVAKSHTADGVRVLERLGLARRDGDDVVLVDRAGLERLAEQ